MTTTTSKRRAAYALTEKQTPEGPRTFWTRIGSAFDNKDGSITVRLEALPISGTLQIRDEDREQRKPAGSASNAEVPF